MKEKLWILTNMVRSFGGREIDIIDSLYRVLKLKDLGYNGSDGEETLFNAMLTKIKWDRTFKGDSRIFFELFNIISSFSKEGCFTLFNLTNEMLGRTSDHVSVPKELSDIMFSNVNEQMSSIFVPDCEKFGYSLYELVIKFPKIAFYTSSQTSENKALMELLFKDTNIQFVSPEIYKEDFVFNKFDQIFSFPIFGVRGLEGDGQFISKDSALIAAQNLLYHLKPNGKLSIILPAKVTFGGGDSEQFRDYINNHYKINAIFSLPNKIFYPFMSINTYLFEFSLGVTDDILIRNYTFEGNKLTLNDKNEKLIFIDEFEQLNGWFIDSAFTDEDEDVILFRESSIKKEKIKYLANVFRGKSVTDKVDNGNVLVVNISNISENGITYEVLDSINEEERKISRYVLEDGDVLITSRGTNVKVAVFNKQIKICIPSSNINVIRTDSKILLGAYLKLFLESNVGMKMLKSIQRGSTIVNINYQDIEMLEVPIPSMENQKELVSKYEKGLEKFNAVIKSAQDEWDRLKTEIQNELF